MDNVSLKCDIKKRLNRIEGQVRGIQKMVDSDEGCGDILVQIAAVRSAINKVGGIILENYTKNCMKSAAAKGDEHAVDELIDTIINFTKYNEVK
jgi:DNA-binding FrmR family transcriptional regulator